MPRLLRKARRGEYVDHNTIAVAEYLDGWIESHSMRTKPRTLSDYRSCISNPGLAPSS